LWVEKNPHTPLTNYLIKTLNDFGFVLGPILVLKKTLIEFACGMTRQLLIKIDRLRAFYFG
jgi:hypothetical protein